MFMEEYRVQKLKEEKEEKMNEMNNLNINKEDTIE